METKKVNLALQGGGSFAALAWGQLDTILKDTRLIIDGISATSAGSIIAIVLAQGFIENGRKGARQALNNFWKKTSDIGLLTGLSIETPIDYLLKNSIDAPILVMFFQNITKFLSPYQFNPQHIDLLRHILEEIVDIETIKRKTHLRLFISATNVRTGKIKIFTKEDLSIDAILASACLPFIYQAVKIDDDYYWDGGYVANPAIYPLIYETMTTDIILFSLIPMKRLPIPMTIPDIIARSREISFNASLMREMRSVAFVTKLLDDNVIKDEYKDRFRRIYLHAINANDILSSLSMTNMLNTNWSFLTKLRDLGKKNAEEWLAKNYDNIGKKTTADFTTWV